MVGTGINELAINEARELARLILDSVEHLFQNENSNRRDMRDYQDEAGGSIMMILAACAQLSTLLRPPEQVIMEVATGFTLSAALRLVVEASVPEIIRTLTGHLDVCKREDGVSVTDIARFCSVDTGKLDQILRLLATHHIFHECPPGGRFAHNRVSEALDSGAVLEDVLPSTPKTVAVNGDISTDGSGRMTENQCVETEEERNKRWAAKYGSSAPGAGLASLVGIITDESMYHATALADTLLSAEGNDHDPDHPLRAPFSLARMPKSITVPSKAKLVSFSEGGSKVPMSAIDSGRITMFKWLNLPINAHRLHRFGCGMRGMAELTPDRAILSGFDWTSLSPDSTIVDIGGGVGAASLPIIRANPELKLVVQDLKGVIDAAPDFWETHYPEALKNGWVRFQVQDFFDPQPPSSLNGIDKKVPAVFLLRMIMHNWPDSEAEEILRNLRTASATSSKLIIVDCVLMPACRGGSSEVCNADVKAGNEEKWKGKEMNEVPQILLPNWGVANGLAYKFDLIMLCNHNARERTLSSFSQILKNTGWKIDEVHAGSGSWMAQIVAIPVDE